MILYDPFIEYIAIDILVIFVKINRGAEYFG